MSIFNGLCHRSWNAFGTACAERLLAAWSPRAALLGALLATLPGAAAANCGNQFPAPVVSLVERLPILNPVGAEVGQMGYLEVASAPEFAPSRVRDQDGRPAQDVQVTTQDGVTGLVAADRVLTFRSASSCIADRLLMRDVPRSELDSDNTLQVKALIGLTEDVVAPNDTTAPESDAVVEVAVRAAPRLDAPLIADLSLYSVVFVHAAVIETVETEDEIIQERWYYVGSESDVTFRADEEGSYQERSRRPLLGWVNSRNLIFWPQRQAIFPNGPQAVDVIYDDPGLAVPKIRLEYIDEAAEGRTVSVLRMPLLSEDEEASVYEVAFPTLRTAVPGAQSEAPSLDGLMPDANLTDDVRVLLSRFSDAAQAIDILFVMDNTESMEDYRDDVLSGIAAANADVADAGAVRVAFAMFGDAYDSFDALLAWGKEGPRVGLDPLWTDLMPTDLPFQFWLSDFDFAGAFPSVSDLGSVFGGVYFDPQGDGPEMGLYGLQVAVESASWRPESVRLVFYIGDDVSRLQPGANLPDVAADVALSLNEAQALFIPINVAGREVDANNETWVAQADSVGAAMRELQGIGGPLPTSIAYGDPAIDDEMQTQEDVRQSIVRLFLLRDLSKEGAVSETDLQSLADEYRVPVNQVLDEFLQSQIGTDRAGLVALSERQDTLLTGYYPSGDAQIYVAITDNERRALFAAFDAACGSMAGTASVRQELESMTRVMTNAFLGETQQLITATSPSGETLADFFGRLTNLPADYFSIFGDFDLDGFIDFVEGTANEGEYRSVQRELCLSAELFARIGANELVERSALSDPFFDPDDQMFEFDTVADLPTYEWLWGVGGLRVIFVPQDFFPRALAN